MNSNSNSRIFLSEEDFNLILNKNLFVEIKKYSEDQPRDYHGRFATTGGSKESESDSSPRVSSVVESPNAPKIRLLDAQPGDVMYYAKHGDVRIVSTEHITAGGKDYVKVTAERVSDGKKISFPASSTKLYPIERAGETPIPAPDEVKPGKSKKEETDKEQLLKYVDMAELKSYVTKSTAELKVLQDSIQDATTKSRDITISTPDREMYKSLIEENFAKMLNITKDVGAHIDAAVISAGEKYMADSSLENKKEDQERLVQSLKDELSQFYKDNESRITGARQNPAALANTYSKEYSDYAKAQLSSVVEVAAKNLGLSNEDVTALVQNDLLSSAFALSPSSIAPIASDRPTLDDIARQTQRGNAYTGWGVGRGEIGIIRNDFLGTISWSRSSLPGESGQYQRSSMAIDTTGKPGFSFVIFNHDRTEAKLIDINDLYNANPSGFASLGIVEKESTKKINIGYGREASPIGRYFAYDGKNNPSPRITAQVFAANALGLTKNDIGIDPERFKNIPEPLSSFPRDAIDDAKITVDIKKQYEEMQRQVKDAQVASASNDISAVKSQILWAAMRELRQFGSPGDLSGIPQTFGKGVDKTKMSSLWEQMPSFIPKDWIVNSEAYSKKLGIFFSPSSGSSFYTNQILLRRGAGGLKTDSMIQISTSQYGTDAALLSVMAHEFTHRVEYTTGGLKLLEASFLYSRINGGAIGPLSWLYGKNVTGNKDNFGNEYAGRVYGVPNSSSVTRAELARAQAFEVTTVGMESMIHNPYRVGPNATLNDNPSRLDSDWRQYLIGALMTIGRK